MVATPLIERISKLDAPDREVDALIAAELEPHIFDAPGFTPVRPIPSFRIGSEGNTIRFEDGGIMCLSYFPRYTASVDAAIALAERVLPGWGFFLRSDMDGHNCGMVYPVHNFVTPGTESGATPAISMCIAILRATEAGQP